MPADPPRRPAVDDPEYLRAYQALCSHEHPAVAAVLADGRVREAERYRLRNPHPVPPEGLDNPTTVG